MNMFRIVLDEAHAIREQSTAQSQAIFNLHAQRRWSVTGTPIQNRLEDLGSVTRFLRLYPYSEKSKFASYILTPFKNENPSALASLRVFVDSFTLRRVKDRINLPPRRDQIISLTFSEQEKTLHEFFRKESNVMMNVIAGEGKNELGGKMYHLVLKAMMVLRQISAHGKELLDQEDRDRFKGLTASDAIDLEEFDSDASGIAERKAYEMLTLMKESSADVCVKCGNFIALQCNEDSPGDRDTVVGAMLPCYDLLCADCFAPLRKTFDKNPGKQARLKCAFCGDLIPVSYSVISPSGFEKFQRSQLASKQNRKQAKVLGQYEGPHTKTKALVSQLLNSIDESNRTPDEGPVKSVIFSSWTSHLDLIEIALEENGIHTFTRLDGTMTLKQRNAALESFRNDNKVTILLATLGAGGVGLNLTSASKVYIMEPQYNPAAVAQAIDRVHRIGQTREVTTVQFIMKDSIEEKIAELAKKKQKLADMSLNRKLDKRELQQTRMREYRSLFK
jgi:SNF2 family DNA or RNA helicase